MNVETIIEEKQLKNGLIMLDKFLGKDFNKNILLELFKHELSKKDGYYSLREDKVPTIIGKDASSALFWCLFRMPFDEDVEKMRGYLSSNNLEFLLSFDILFIEKIISAKKFNDNPLGYNSVNFTYAEGNEKCNLYIKRNDSSELILTVPPIEVLNMTKDILFYYEGVLGARKIGLSEEEKSLVDELSHIITNINRVGSDCCGSK
ncbi:MAG: hypothetical protein E7A11_04305 [Clostridium sp.]|uniref:hypothetical protein n=1 Tax=Bacillota TaxID=1239 RepID=UPI00290080DA|nr:MULTISPECIES: hypothetical protein [Bacillota]MDU1077152.1 hypothetical protein [Clostridium sp.]MDU1124494.1 hypothetical protein [Clostridium sp.]MDU3678218.1 hypothetical protein [Clostridium sp.]MDU5739632.1 hypothetical protein [Clostridium sp.]MDU5763452.1 hypothetical protein [Veillonella sp.]